jgi:transposase-like protein
LSASPARRRGVTQVAARDPSSPEDARLRRTLVLTMQGKSQGEIAREFRVNERTIRRWIAEARRRRLVAFKTTGPEELLAQTHFLHETLTAVLLKRLERAERRGDDRVLTDCARELRGTERDRYAILELVGAFDAWRLNRPAPPEESPAAQGARAMIEAMLEVFAPKGRPVTLDALSARERTDDDAGV